MKRFLMCALLFSYAATAQGQEPVTHEPAGPVSQEPVAQEEVADVQPADVQEDAAPQDEAPAPVVDLKTRSATAAAIDAATLRAPADADVIEQGIDAPRNFWWLVAAIVLGGVILAVLL